MLDFSKGNSSKGAIVVPVVTLLYVFPILCGAVKGELGKCGAFSESFCAYAFTKRLK